MRDESHHQGGEGEQGSAAEGADQPADIAAIEAMSKKKSLTSSEVWTLYRIPPNTLWRWGQADKSIVVGKSGHDLLYSNDRVKELAEAVVELKDEFEWGGEKWLYYELAGKRHDLGDAFLKRLHKHGHPKICQGKTIGRVFRMKSSAGGKPLERLCFSEQELHRIARARFGPVINGQFAYAKASTLKQLFPALNVASLNIWAKDCPRLGRGLKHKDDIARPGHFVYRINEVALVLGKPDILPSTPEDSYIDALKRKWIFVGLVTVAEHGISMAEVRRLVRQKRLKKTVREYFCNTTVTERLERRIFVLEDKVIAAGKGKQEKPASPRAPLLDLAKTLIGWTAETAQKYLGAAHPITRKKIRIAADIEALATFKQAKVIAEMAADGSVPLTTASTQTRFDIKTIREWSNKKNWRKDRRGRKVPPCPYRENGIVASQVKWVILPRGRAKRMKFVSLDELKKIRKKVNDGLAGAWRDQDGTEWVIQRRAKLLGFKTFELTQNRNGKMDGVALHSKKVPLPIYRNTWGQHDVWVYRLNSLIDIQAKRSGCTFEQVKGDYDARIRRDDEILQSVGRLGADLERHHEETMARLPKGKPKGAPPRSDPAEDSRLVAAFKRDNAATGVKRNAYTPAGSSNEAFIAAYNRHMKREQKRRESV
jgi:hypothetical protein